MANFMELFNNSYEEVMGQTEDTHRRFFLRFYEIFKDKSPDIMKKFAGTNIEAQVLMMRRSLTFMVNFFVSKKSTDYLINLARIHGKQEFDIQPELYQLWLDALLETIRECSRHYTPETGLAWRIVLAPGIEFMKFYYNIEAD